MSPRTLTIGITGLVAIVGFAVIAQRNALLAWMAIILAILLLIKIVTKPSSIDLKMSLGLAIMMPLLACATYFYVISVYESGEVIELSMDTQAGAHTARVWVFEVDDEPWVYYDAPPLATAALLKGLPITVTQANLTRTVIPDAAAADQLSTEDAEQVFKAMADKYGDRMTAADVYYLLLGRPSNRTGLVVRLVEG